MSSYGPSFVLLFQSLREDNRHETEAVVFQFLSDRLGQAQFQILLPLFVVLGPADQRASGGRAEETVTTLAKLIKIHLVRDDRLLQVSIKADPARTFWTG